MVCQAGLVNRPPVIQSRVGAPVQPESPPSILCDEVRALGAAGCGMLKVSSVRCSTLRRTVALCGGFLRIDGSTGEVSDSYRSSRLNCGGRLTDVEDWGSQKFKLFSTSYVCDMCCNA